MERITRPRRPLINLGTQLCPYKRTFKRHVFVHAFVNDFPDINESIRSQMGDTARAKKRGC
jgi:hypothetical protein